jgi:hypothetical protein
MKQINLTNTRLRTKANDIRRNVESCGLSGWELDRQRQVIQDQGHVTGKQLAEMRDRAAFALKCIDDAIADAMAITGKAVTEIVVYNVVQVRGDLTHVCFADLSKDEADANCAELSAENPSHTYHVEEA